MADSLIKPLTQQEDITTKPVAELPKKAAAPKPASTDIKSKVASQRLQQLIEKAKKTKLA
jgi:hypothetical protein